MSGFFLRAYAPHRMNTTRSVLAFTARITSSAGSVVAPVEVSDEMMAGVVSLPHGWGHDVDGVRLGVAARYPGVNANLLVPGDLIDVPSATHAVNGFPVRVEPV